VTRKVFVGTDGSVHRFNVGGDVCSNDGAGLLVRPFLVLVAGRAERFAGAGIHWCLLVGDELRLIRGAPFQNQTVRRPAFEVGGSVVVGDEAFLLLKVQQRAFAEVPQPVTGEILLGFDVVSVQAIPPDCYSGSCQKLVCEAALQEIIPCGHEIKFRGRYYVICGSDVWQIATSLPSTRPCDVLQQAKAGEQLRVRGGFVNSPSVITTNSGYPFLQSIHSL
jgi:hypothetical protein